MTAAAPRVTFSLISALNKEYKRRGKYDMRRRRQWED